VHHGKRFAISYDTKEIDLQRSSVQISENPNSQAAAQATTQAVVKPESGQRSLLTINHGYSVAREPDQPEPTGKSSKGQHKSNSASTAGNTAKQSNYSGSASPVSPKTNYPVGTNPGSGSVTEQKSSQDYQAQQEAYRNNQQEYQQKLKEYEKTKRQVEEYNKQVDEHNEQVKNQKAAAQQQPTTSYSGRKPYLENSYPEMMNRGSKPKPYLNKSYPEMMNRGR
jgi:hypothetical protein